MKSKFRFAPVGQGLFYTGSIDGGNYRFVYDCGAHERDLAYLNSAVDEYITECNKQKQSVAFAVISHLHFDHFSGLKRLMEGVAVHKLFLPYVGTDRNLIELVLAYEIFVRGGVRTRAKPQKSDRYELYRFMLNLYLEPNFGQTIISFMAEEQADRVGYYSQIFADGIPWKFLLVNPSIFREEFDDFETLLNRLLHARGDISIRQLVQKENFKEIKNIYVKVFQKKNLNDFCTLLLHYPDVTHGVCYRGIEKRHRFYFSPKYSSCTVCSGHKDNLLTVLSGDAQTNELMDVRLNQDIQDAHATTLIQVPHHGSQKTWENLGFWKELGSEYVIPFGWGNTYGHPSAKVIEETDGHFVTQTKSFDYEIDIT